MTGDLPPRLESVRLSYDAVARRYRQEVAGELAGKPLDRALLTAFAEEVGRLAGPGGRVWDVGCGPGHVTAFLSGLGVPVAGLDLSPGMIELARERYRGLEFSCGSMTELPGADQSWAGVVSFYSLIHLTDDGDLRTALREFRRVLTDRGLLLVAVHVSQPDGGARGHGLIHLDSWWDNRVDLTFRFFDCDWLAAQIRKAGFAIEAVTRRQPIPGPEAQTERAYLLASAR